MKTVEQILAERIKFLRDKKGWKQPDLAAECDLSRSAIAQIETGKIWPSIETVRKLAKALGVSESALFSEQIETVSIPVEVTVQDALKVLQDHVNATVTTVKKSSWLDPIVNDLDEVEKDMLQSRIEAIKARRERRARKASVAPLALKKRDNIG